MSRYRFSEVPKGLKVYYFKVTKKLTRDGGRHMEVWRELPNIGNVVWMSQEKCKNPSKRYWTVENNRHRINFDKDCFMKITKKEALATIAAEEKARKSKSSIPKPLFKVGDIVTPIPRERLKGDIKGSYSMYKGKELVVAEVKLNKAKDGYWLRPEEYKGKDIGGLIDTQATLVVTAPIKVKPTYKHRPVPTDLKGKVTYYIVTKKPVWDSGRESECLLQIGDITWDKKGLDWFGNLHVENNRYGVNYKRSCFRALTKKEYAELKGLPVEASTAKDLTVKRYRFKTEEEFKDTDSWNYSMGTPVGWNNAGKMNGYIGTELKGEFLERFLSKGSTSFKSLDGEWSFKKSDVVEMIVVETKETIYRYKTEAEFKKDGLWDKEINAPVKWNDCGEMNHLLGQELTEKCVERFLKLKPGEGFEGHDGWSMSHEDVIIEDATREDGSEAVKEIVLEKTKYKSCNTMNGIEEVLNKVYDNKELRSSVVPLFIGDPGMGKTKIIEKFAKERGAKLVELITSQMSPFEISGIAMPDKDTKKMTYYNFDKLETLKDGDILFFDELLNGNPVVLNACLTILEQRRLISGKDLPNVMIIAAANPQGMVPLTPQIKERFLWYNVKFDASMWQDYMKNKYDMPMDISAKLCALIKDEKFASNNFYTPRSVDKAIQMIAKDCPTPYADTIYPILDKIVTNTYKKRRIVINKKEGLYLAPGESILWTNILKKKKA